MPTSKSIESTPRSVDAFAVSTIEVFRDLTLSDRRRLAAMMSAQSYSPGQFILSNATTCRDVYFLLDGSVRVCAYSAHGKQVQFEDLGPGQMFGEIAALDGGSRTSDCIAVTEVLVGTMKHDHFFNVLCEFPAINRAVILRLTSLVRRQMERVFEFSTAPVATRLRYELLRLASANETGDVDIFVANPPTHADIAARISTHREAVTREMRKLEKNGIITWRRTECVIHRISELIQEKTTD